MGNTTQLILAGSAGQGFIATGSILTKAVTKYEGKNAAQRNFYGPEKRAGMASTEIIISTEEIMYPTVEKADVMVILSNVALPRYGKNIPKDCILIYDSNEVELFESQLPSKFYNCNLVNRSRELNGFRSLNIMCLGAILAALDIAKTENVLKVITDTFPGEVGLNMKIFHAGMEALHMVKGA